MKILEKFKSSLISGKIKPSKVTIKNYLSDVRKFILWFETQFQISFNPKKINADTIDIYKTYLNNQKTPLSSIERYLSSLRKFFNFLTRENLINTNPFTHKSEAKQSPDGHFDLYLFKVYLLSNNVSKVTTKNYLMDIKQFLTWLEKVIKPEQNTNILEQINELVITEYRDRLLYKARLSPASVNRKLSSLRKYTAWLENKASIATTGLNTEHTGKKINENLTNSNPSPSKKTKENIFSIIIDHLITLPIVKLLEKLEFIAWKINGSKIFTPARSNLIKIPAAKNNYEAIRTIHNISKSLYSPLKISTEPLPVHKKFYFHVRYTRPKWYKKYHSYPIAHYLHISVLIIYTSAVGLLLFSSIYGNYPQEKKVFASPPWSQPKILAFQGKLNDALNNPISTPTSLRFAIYNNQIASGSALLWQEVQTVNPDQEGVFQAAIGQKNSIPSSIFSDNPAIYLGMTVGNENELQPRQELATVSYSANAQKLQGLLPITQNSAGTNNVILALDSAGNLTIGGKATPIFEASGGQFTLSGKTLLLTSVEGSDGDVKISPDGKGIIDLQKPLQNTTNYNNIESAQGAVEIDDLLAILATSSGQSALTINQNSTGPLISASASGTAMFTLENNGTGVFAGNLFINGDNLTSANTSFNLLNTNTLTLNIGNAATTISIGADTGNTTIKNMLLANAGIIAGSGITPSATGEYELGSPTNRWKNAYLDNLDIAELSIGQTATQSSKFQIFGSGDKAGTASTSGQLTFTNHSQINLLNNSHLGFYNSFSGDSGIKTANPSLYLASSGNVGIGTDTPSAKLHINGDIRAQKIYASDTQLQQADLAENYISSQNLEPGDIIMPEGKDNNLAIIKTTIPYESKTIGIVSTKPAITLNSDAQADNEHPYILPIAISGRVPVKVTTENGLIEAGDELTTSSIPGVAMKATKSGIVIGKALENYTNPNTTKIDKIMIFANLSYSSASNSTGYYEKYNLQDNTGNLFSLIQNLTQTILPNIEVGFIQAKKTVTDSLNVTTENITIGSQTLKEYITEIIRNSLKKEVEKEIAKYQIPNTKYSASDLLSPLASESATETDQLPPSDATPSATYVTNITNIYNTLAATPGADIHPASDSASLASNSALTDNLTASSSAIPDTDLHPASASPILNISASADISTIQQFAASQKRPHEVDSPLVGLVPLGDNNLTMPSSLSGSLSYTPNLQVFGHSTLSDVAVVGNLNIGGSLILADNAVNTIGNDLELQPLRQGNLSIMGNLVAIDTSGNLKVDGNAVFAKNVTIKGKLEAKIIAPIPDSDLVVQLNNNPNKSDPKSAIRNPRFVIQNATGSAILTVNQTGDLHASGSGNFSSLSAKSFKIIRGAQADTSLTQTTASSSAGTAVITAYETERTIISPFITKDSLIYLTATSDTQGIIPYIARQTENSFTIAIPYVVNKDIKINWWIIN